jgi:hypothetical protein
MQVLMQASGMTPENRELHPWPKKLSSHLIFVLAQVIHRHYVHISPLPTDRSLFTRLTLET